MDRLQSMRVFERVVDEGSFAAAARALDLSPAVVTRLLADLEDHLSARLLQRTTRHLSLTFAGQAYLDGVRRVLHEIDELHAMTSSQTQELAGVLRILTPPVLATQMVAPLLSGFRARYPRIWLDIEVDSTDAPQVEQYDITLLSEQVHVDADHVRRKVVTADSVLVASPGYLKRRGSPASPFELSQHDCLHLTHAGRLTRTWKMLSPAPPGRMLELEVASVLRSNHADTLICAALGGAGITPAAMELAAPYLVRGGLVRVLPDWITDRVSIYAAFPTRKFLPQRTRVFLDYLVEEAGRMARVARQACSPVVQ